MKYERKICFSSKKGDSATLQSPSNILTHEEQRGSRKILPFHNENLQTPPFCLFRKFISANTLEGHLILIQWNKYVPYLLKLN